MCGFWSHENGENGIYVIYSYILYLINNTYFVDTGTL